MNILSLLLLSFFGSSDQELSVVCVCSVLQHIPQYSPECDGSSGVTMELPAKAGLAVLKVSHHCTDLNVFCFSPGFIVAAQGGIITLMLVYHFTCILF